jgi:hypothetical protein
VQKHANKINIKLEALKCLISLDLKAVTIFKIFFLHGSSKTILAFLVLLLSCSSLRWLKTVTPPM